MPRVGSRAGMAGDRPSRPAAAWLKVPLRLVPRVPMMVKAATAISAAISPYSIAVTPDSSLIIFLKKRGHQVLLDVQSRSDCGEPSNKT